MNAAIQHVRAEFRELEATDGVDDSDVDEENIVTKETDGESLSPSSPT